MEWGRGGAGVSELVGREGLISSLQYWMFFGIETYKVSKNLWYVHKSYQGRSPDNVYRNTVNPDPQGA